MADMKAFIMSHLLEPLKQYPTTVQNAMIELIAEKLEMLYEYTVKFPEIISPNQYRLDILQAIADQFSFTVREEADLQEQVDILDNILHVYAKRGSVDTIENMWRYYGGDLPKNVKVVIPSYNLFRYSISALSGTHVLQDNEINRTGVYEIQLINNDYPIPDLKEFLIKELVAAGNYIYFTNVIHADLIGDEEGLSSHYLYEVSKDTLKYIQLSVLTSHQGFTWSGYNALSRNLEEARLSGKPDIFMEISRSMQFNLVDMIMDSEFYFNIETEKTSIAIYRTYVNLYKYISYDKILYCTPESPEYYIAHHLYDSNGAIVPQYRGYFVLGKTLLGEEVI